MITSVAALAVAAALASEPEPPLFDDTPLVHASPWRPSLRVAAIGRADLTVDGPRDNTMGGVIEVAGEVVYEPTPAWEARVKARARSLAEARPGHAEGRFVPDLIDLALVWRPELGPEITLGVVGDLRWPTLVTPQPPDRSLGPLEGGGLLSAESTVTARPVPLLIVAQSLSDWRLQTLWQPWFVPARWPLRRSGWAPIADVLGVGDFAGVAGPAGLAGGSAGLRLSGRLGELSLGATWLWRVEPIPDETTFGRQHRAGLDLGLTTGPLAWRFELAFADHETAWTAAGSATRGPALEALLITSAQPLVMLELEAGLRAVAFLDDVGDDMHFLERGPRDAEVLFRLGLLLAYDGVLRLDLRGRVALARADFDLAAALALRTSRKSEVALGLGVYDGNAVAVGRGALYDGDDEVWVRWTHAW